MKYQMRRYINLFSDYIEFVPFNAPHICYEAFDATIEKMFDPPFYSWYFYQSESGDCRGITESVEYTIEFMNNNGPFDGVLGFSQGRTIIYFLGCLLARIILKLEEFKTKFTKLNYGVPSFGILFAGIFTEKAKYFPDYQKDSFKLMIEYKQPMLWVYDDRDSLKPLIERSLVMEGDYTVIKHR
jgi:hypothetical protein